MTMEEDYLDHFEGDVIKISRCFDAPHTTVVVESEGTLHYIRLMKKEQVQAAYDALARKKKLLVTFTVKVVE